MIPHDRLPLLRGDFPYAARRNGTPITRTAFLAEIAALADALLDRGFVVNLCTDRIRFAAGLAAAMLRGQITLLPADGSARAVDGLRQNYPDLYALTDTASGLPCPCFAYPDLPMAATDRMPAFPPGQIAAILFTSGSTGRPSPAPRSWGRLVAASLGAGAAIGIADHAGAALVATVPHAHSYGLESAVMLAMQHGLLLDAGRPFFPADVAAALPGVLVTTPVHLRSLVEGATTILRAGLVLSATAPLAADLAARAEAVFDAPVFEIYGCSEAGQIAARRSVAGPEWGCLAGFSLRLEAGAIRVGGPHEDDVTLSDEMDLRGEDSFILLGRTADQVNIAGKRGSLAHLTGVLNGIEGVADGVFLMPDDTAAGITTRLAALAVAPGLDEAAILTALRARIDPAFLPRPLRVVDALPRNALGKLPRAELLRLAGLPPSTDIIRFPADHPTASGHFPGNPIIPGAVLLDTLLPALGKAGGLAAVKFHHPVRPGDAVTITRDPLADESCRFEGRIAGSDRLAISGTTRPPSPSR
jgi:hypothetical protein